MIGVVHQSDCLNDFFMQKNTGTDAILFKWINMIVKKCLANLVLFNTCLSNILIDLF